MSDNRDRAAHQRSGVEDETWWRSWAASAARAAHGTARQIYEAFSGAH